MNEHMNANYNRNLNMQYLLLLQISVWIYRIKLIQGGPKK